MVRLHRLLDELKKRLIDQGLLNRHDQEVSLDIRAEWKGKDIISSDVWLRLLRNVESNSYVSFGQLLQYLPDSYISDPLSGSVPKQWEQAWKKWRLEYIQYLDEKKDADYGKHKCTGCMIAPGHNAPDEFTNYLGLNKVMLRYFDEAIRPTEECPVHNFFVCPYAAEQPARPYVKELFSLTPLEAGLSNMLHYYYWETEAWDSFCRRTHIVDFAAGKVWSYDDGRLSMESPPCNVRDVLKGLEKIPRPKIEIRTALDIYKLITDHSLLRNALYLRFLDMSDEEISTSYGEQDRSKIAAELAQKLIAVTCKAKLEDLRGFSGKSAAEEEKDSKWYQDHTGYDTYAPPDIASLPKCRHCSDFATITCTNCNCSICVDHWREHMNNVHQVQPAGL